jgi:hypothetical protein
MSNCFNSELFQFGNFSKNSWSTIFCCNFLTIGRKLSRHLPIVVLNSEAWSDNSDVPKGSSLGHVGLTKTVIVTITYFVI